MFSLHRTIDAAARADICWVPDCGLETAIVAECGRPFCADHALDREQMRKLPARTVARAPMLAVVEQRAEDIDFAALRRTAKPRKPRPRRISSPRERRLWRFDILRLRETGIGRRQIAEQQSTTIFDVDSALRYARRERALAIQLSLVLDHVVQGWELDSHCMLRLMQVGLTLDELLEIGPEQLKETLLCPHIIGFGRASEIVTYFESKRSAVR